MPESTKNVVLEVIETEPLGKVKIAALEDVAYDDNANWRIVGGSDAEPGQFPHIVSLRWAYLGSHFCGGAIVSSVYILSAAHCTRG